MIQRSLFGSFQFLLLKRRRRKRRRPQPDADQNAGLIFYRTFCLALWQKYDRPFGITWAGSRFYPKPGPEPTPPQESAQRTREYIEREVAAWEQSLRITDED